MLHISEKYNIKILHVNHNHPLTALYTQHSSVSAPQQLYQAISRSLEITPTWVWQIMGPDHLHDCMTQFSYLISYMHMDIYKHAYIWFYIFQFSCLFEQPKCTTFFLPQQFSPSTKTTFFLPPITITQS